MNRSPCAGSGSCEAISNQWPPPPSKYTADARAKIGWRSEIQETSPRKEARQEYMETLPEQRRRATRELGEFYGGFSGYINVAPVRARQRGVPHSAACGQCVKHFLRVYLSTQPGEIPSTTSARHYTKKKKKKKNRMAFGLNGRSVVRRGWNVFLSLCILFS